MSVEFPVVGVVRGFERGRIREEGGHERGVVAGGELPGEGEDVEGAVAGAGGDGGGTAGGVFGRRLELGGRSGREFLMVGA